MRDKIEAADSIMWFLQKRYYDLNEVEHVCTLRRWRWKPNADELIPALKKEGNKVLHPRFHESTDYTGRVNDLLTKGQTCLTAFDRLYLFGVIGIWDIPSFLLKGDR